MKFECAMFVESRRQSVSDQMKKVLTHDWQNGRILQIGPTNLFN